MSGPHKGHRPFNANEFIGALTVGSTSTARGPSRDRALPGKKRIRARRQASRELPVLTAPAQVAFCSLAELEAKTVPSLQNLAKTMGLHGYSKMKRDELIEFIYQSEENAR